MLRLKPRKSKPKTQKGNLSRRGFLGISILGAATVGGGVSLAAPIPALAADSGNVYKSSQLLGNSGLSHLLRRASFGPTAAMFTEASAITGQAWLDKQLNPTNIANPIDDFIKAQYPRIYKTPKELADGFATGGTYEVRNDIIKASIARAVWSEKQLLEVMSDFWYNHFNVYAPADGGWQYKADYYEGLRNRALTSFKDLLQFATPHPAMLVYLNNNLSTKESPNENLGRELMELHTLGVGSYAESDVKNSALILTGMTARNAAFYFEPKNHYVGPVKVMTFTHKNDDPTKGMDVIRAYLDFLATHPSTAKRVATKLAQHFISDTPPDSIIKTLANVYIANGTKIIPVLKALFSSAEFKASIGQKNRRPYEDVVATVRALGHKQATENSHLDALNNLITSAGHRPLCWPQPDGYPDVISLWLSPASILSRMNSHYNLGAQKALPTLSPGWRSLLPTKTPANWGIAIDALSQKLIRVNLQAEHKQVLLTTISRKATDVVTEKDMEQFVPNLLIPAILDSPYFWSY